jgi:hypothetical protein
MKMDIPIVRKPVANNTNTDSLSCGETAAAFSRYAEVVMGTNRMNPTISPRNWDRNKMPAIRPALFADLINDLRREG